MLDRWNQLDRRWIFLAMGLAVAVPVLLRVGYPEQPTRDTQLVFAAVERLARGDRVLLALDYDAASAAELHPMALALTRHALLREARVAFLTLWPTGKPMIDDTIGRIVEGDFAARGLTYGEHFVDLGYQPGYEVAITQLATDLRRQTDRDATGTPLDKLPIMDDIAAVRDFDLVLNVSAGYPGAKEWVQFAGTQGGLLLGVGATGVQAPLLRPYVPDQIVGLLAAIKGAAEYETLLMAAYPQDAPASTALGLRRMGPQLWAHLLMVSLIVFGNVILWLPRLKRAAA